MHPLWFEFELQPPAGAASEAHYRPDHVVQAGYDDQFGWVGPADSQPVMQAFGTHLAVFSIKDGRVELAIRSRRFAPNDPAMYKVKASLGDLENHRLTYTPGKALEIPVEGGGTLTLRGEIADTQPKLSNGLPVEPKPDQIVLNSPIVIRDKTVLADMQGGGVLAEDGMAAVVMAKGMGRLVINLQPFAGAIRAEADWGKIGFTLNGQSYTVFSASPICGGDQPHAVWVAIEPDDAASPWSIGTLRLTPSP
jgi:hypothetical protein